MGDFYHGRRIHYSGGSFKMRARSKSEVKSYNNSEVGLESDGGPTSPDYIRIPYFFPAAYIF